MAPVKRYTQFLGPAPVTDEQGDIIRGLAKMRKENISDVLRDVIDFYIASLPEDIKAAALRALEPEPVTIQEE